MHIHAILCARSSRCDYLDQWCQVTLVSLYMQHVSACLTLWRASARHSASMSIYVVYTDTKPYRCTIAHQTRNSVGFLPWKWGILIALFSHRKLGENSVRCAMMHLKWSTVGFSPRKYGEMLLDIHRGNLVATSNTLESIDRDHNYSEIKPQSPTH